jgi:peptide/nickel transport system substrate-binding protein
MKERMLKKISRISFVSTVIAMAGLLICLGGIPATAGEPTIAIYVQDFEPTLDWDPAVESAQGQMVLGNIYETLLRYDVLENKFIPILATGFTKTDDGMSWTFSIRKGVRFHDGSELDAEAVKFSIERIIRIGKGVSFIWAAVDKITVVDKYTVKFDLQYPAPLDLISAGSVGSFIISQKAAQSHDEDWFTKGNAVGTGPYKLKSTAIGEEAILQAFDDYWKGWGKKRYDYVAVKKIMESSARRQMVEKGDATVALSLPAEDLDQLKTNPNVNVHVGPSLENLFLMFNTQKAPLNNKLVRQALAYAFPYDKVVKYAASGYAVQARGPFPEKVWGHNKSLFQYSQDLEKAKQLLKQANFSQNGKKLLFTYESAIEEQKKLAELFKSDLAKIGVEVELRGMPWESQWELSKSTKADDRQDMMTLRWWPSYCDPYDWAYSLFHTQEYIQYNLAYWENSEFDQLVDQATEVSVLEREKSIAMFHQAQQIMIDENPAIFVYDKNSKIVTHKSLKGFKDNPAYSNVVFFHETYPE